MKVIILSGGKGTRLPDSARDIPKALIKIQGKPLIEHQIELFEHHGFSNLRFSLGFRADYIIDHLAGRYEYVVEPEPLGTGGAIKFAAKDLDEPFMAINGDVLTDLNLKEFLDHYKNVGEKKNTLVVYEVEDARDFGLLKLEGNYILKFQEKPSEERVGFINAGFYILRPEVFKEFPQDSFSIETDVFPKLAAEQKLAYYLHKGFWTDVGTEERLRQVNI